MNTKTKKIKKKNFKEVLKNYIKSKPSVQYHLICNDYT